MPPLPTTFSTITGWARRSPRRGLRIRPTTSTPAPAGYGTTIVSGRLGQSCAPHGPGRTSAPASAPTMIVGGIAFSLEQPDDLAIGADVDGIGGWHFGQARHGHD